MRFRKAAGIDHQHRRSQLLATPLIHCSSQQLPSHPSTAALGCMGSGGAGGSLTSVLTYPPLFLADQRKILDPSFRAAVGSLYIQIYNVHMIVKTKWRPPGARRWRRLYRLSPPSPRSISGPRRHRVWPSCPIPTGRLPPPPPHPSRYNGGMLVLIGADAADVCVCSRARVSYASACVVEYETCVRHLHTCNFVALISGCVCVCVCVCVYLCVCV